jgi:beta-glucosidase-like glycosyl hydrolase
VCPQFYDFPHIIWDLFIAEAVEAGRLSESILDDRVADLLRVKMMLGLFDNPFTGLSLSLSPCVCVCVCCS